MPAHMSQEGGSDEGLFCVVFWGLNSVVFWDLICVAFGYREERSGGISSRVGLKLGLGLGFGWFCRKCFGSISFCCIGDDE